MKEHVQKTGVRKYAGDDLIELQAEPLKAIQKFFQECGICIVQGCEVTAAGNLFNVAPGVVALSGTDADGNDAFKVVPFEGAENVVLPVYLTMTYTTLERVYGDSKIKPVAYNYIATASSVRPANGTDFLEITSTGGKKFVDAIRITDKLDKTGNGKDVTVTFVEAAKRENLSSGEKLSVLWGKVWKWFTDLKAVAFSGKASDLTDDENHRLVTDTEKAGWDDKYTKNQTDMKDAAGLKAAKDYTDSLSDNVYKKSETYVRTEIDDKDAATLRSAKDYTDTLSGNVYKKTDTYNRTDIDNRDAAALQAAKNYAAQKVAEVVNSAPGTLDTLQELAAALGNDPNFATSIMALLGGKADTVHKHTKSQITDFPASMPASDVYAWAKQANKPSYTPSEIGAAAASHTHPASQVTEETNKRFMTDAERSKLSGIAAGANAYTHPASHPATMITEDSTHRFVTDSEKANWNGKAAGNHTHYSLVPFSISGNQNLNDYITPGMYYCGQSAVAATIANCPSGYAFALLVESHAGVKQTLTEYVTSGFKIYTRNYYNGVWGAWQRIYTTTDKPTLAELGAAATNHNHDSTYATKSHKHTKTEISDFPSSLPASDVSSWAKQPNKPTYTPTEVGAAATNHNHDIIYAAKSHKHTKAEITDFPTSMPASDVYAWAKQANKPSYTASEVGAISISDFIKGTPGSINIGGFIIKWGKLLCEPNKRNIYSFPTWFPNMALCATCAMEEGSARSANVVISALSGNAIGLKSFMSENVYIYWIAIGY